MLRDMQVRNVSFLQEQTPTLYLPQERECRMRMTSSSGRLARVWMSLKDSASSAERNTHNQLTDEHLQRC